MNTHTPQLSDPRNWACCPLKDRENYLPGRAGLYAILDRKTRHIYYIGKANELSDRWRGTGHHRYRQALQEIESPILAWQVCDGRSVGRLETELIRHFRKKGEANWNYTEVPNYRPTATTPKQHSPAEDDFVVQLIRFISKNWIIIALCCIVALILEAQGNGPVAPVSPATSATPMFSAGEYGSAVVGRIPEGAAVEILVCEDDFVQVRHNGAEGWVRDFEVSGCP